ncbi:MAG: sulfotransferase [Pseudomonadota bacterium]
MSNAPSVPDAPMGDVSTALRHAFALLQENPEAAHAQAREILKVVPGEKRARLLLAMSDRHAGRIEAAIDALSSIATEHPAFAPAQAELGLALISAARWPEAEAALRTAVSLQPDLASAWKALGDLLAERGDDAGSDEAYQQHVRCSVRDPLLAKAGNALFSGQLGLAEGLCRESLKQDPTNVSAIRMLADVAIRIGRHDDAAKLLHRCLELAPDFHFARSNFAHLLFKMFRYREALVEIDRVIAAEPNRPSHLLLKASILARIGEAESAITIYEQVLERYPDQPRTRMSMGHALKTVGRQAEAIEAYRRAVHLAPGLGEAYWSLANLKTFEFDDAQIVRMRREIANSTASIDDSYHLSFALGKALEDRGEYEESFHYYAQGNAARRKTVRWDADEHARNLDQHKAFFTREFLAREQPCGNPSEAPIFIVGLPRAGSTLLEQILASHSRVEGTMELPDIISIARRLSRKKKRSDESQYPAVLGRLSADELGALGAEYLQRTQIHRCAAPRFIDKMPNNFAHIGLIHLILPNARIIDARRYAMACCFSGYKQLFASGQNFSYSLEEIGRYYRDYVGLMDHWDQVLPGRVLRVNYEQMVTDTEAEVRRMLDYCDLPFEPSCVEFYRNERAVRTASSEQVRQPIYSGALEQWRHYEGFLSPLRDQLGSLVR